MCLWLPMYWKGCFYLGISAHHWCARLSSKSRLLCGALHLICQLFSSLFLRLPRALRDLGKHFYITQQQILLSLIIRNIILVSTVFATRRYFATNLWKWKQLKQWKFNPMHWSVLFVSWSFLKNFQSCLYTAKISSELLFLKQIWLMQWLGKDHERRQGNFKWILSFFSREHIKLSYALPELGNITRHRSLQMLWWYASLSHASYIRNKQIHF